MDCIVGAEKIPHYNKANLCFMVTNVERFSIYFEYLISFIFIACS
jgi:hypothetical protein